MRKVGRHRKKNGGCDPSGNGAGGRRVAWAGVRRAAQERTARFGSDRDGYARRDAPCGRRRFGATAGNVPACGARSELRLWTASALSRDAAQTHRHSAGPYPGPSRLLPVLSLSAGPEPGGFGITCKAVERQAEAIGADIARRNQQDIQRAIQLDLPEMTAPGAEIMYVE